MSSNPRKGRQGEDAAERDIRIGKVVSVNVPRREVRIAPETSHPERFHEVSILRLETKRGKKLCLTPKQIRVTASAVIAKIETDDEDLIASTRGATVVVPYAERFPLPENEYYEDDLIGLVVKDKDGAVIGKLHQIWETPANDIYQVLDEEGGEILIPAIEDVILNVDVEGGEITADISILT